ncbi:KUP/HAK/KT family potassium transporter [Amorphus orientalis]|uniref:Probable potassium transport system protein Kup n=1 Tax=Amorphus orientalis TaxID=649198 RepID=A0AAE3VRC4_9HYPH|nr:KUP/HAK/KT family potassium transporter [Amorphus orientalis]MDQ0316563.1 KUP system potassium uptake protein [Amorphus orientalis]
MTGTGTDTATSRRLLVVGALGIVFGDIGTSPLYSLREAVLAAGHLPPEIAVPGVLSLITWAIVLAIAVKYVGLVLRVDNEGEGGILALATLLGVHSVRKRWQIGLLMAALLGAAMLFGDGIITPAISVLSAIEGLKLAAPSLDPYVVPITVVVLAALFLAQRAGTHRIGGLFGPIMLIWFVVLGALGVYGILGNPQVLTALSPHHCLVLMMHDPVRALVVLSAVFLAITGGEALYADLGQFGRKAIARAWYFIAMPGLLLNYYGQGALILDSPETLSNPFYSLAPHAIRIPLLLLATAATVIASQAVITGVMSLARQAMEIGFMVPLRTIHTAAEHESHIYLPAVNLFLGVLSILVVVGFGSSTALAGAYGLAVSTAMITTTVLYAAALLHRRSWPRPLAIGVAAALLVFDLAFFVANLGKIEGGGWLPLSLAGFALLVMASWRVGVRRTRAWLEPNTVPLSQFAAKEAKETANIDRPAVVLTRSAESTPTTLVLLDKLLGTTFARSVVVTVSVLGRPRVTGAEQVRTTPLEGGMLLLEVSVGYMQRINLPALIGPALKENGINSEEVVYVVGFERPVAPAHIRRPGDVLAKFFAVLARFMERTVDRFELPRRRTLEVGVPIHL